MFRPSTPQPSGRKGKDATPRTSEPNASERKRTPSGFTMPCLRSRNPEAYQDFMGDPTIRPKDQRGDTNHITPTSGYSATPHAAVNEPEQMTSGTTNAFFSVDSAATASSNIDSIPVNGKIQRPAMFMFRGTDDDNLKPGFHSRKPRETQASSFNGVSQTANAFSAANATSTNTVVKSNCFPALGANNSNSRNSESAIVPIKVDVEAPSTYRTTPKSIMTPGDSEELRAHGWEIIEGTVPTYTCGLFSFQNGANEFGETRNHALNDGLTSQTQGQSAADKLDLASNSTTDKYATVTEKNTSDFGWETDNTDCTHSRTTVIGNNIVLRSTSHQAKTYFDHQNKIMTEHDDEFHQIGDDTNESLACLKRLHSTVVMSTISDLMKLGNDIDSLSDRIHIDAGLLAKKVSELANIRNTAKYDDSYQTRLMEKEREIARLKEHMQVSLVSREQLATRAALFENAKKGPTEKVDAIEEQNLQIKELENDNIDRTEQMKRLEDNVSHANIQLQQKDATISKMSEWLKDAREKPQKDIDELNGKVRMYQNDLKKMQDVVKAAQAEASHARDEVKSLEVTLANQKLRHAKELEQAGSERKQEVTERSTRLQKAYEGLQQALEDEQYQRRNVETEVIDLKNQLEKSQHDRRASNSSLESDEELRRLKREAKKLEKEIENERVGRVAAENSIRQLETKRDEKERALREAKAGTQAGRKPVGKNKKNKPIQFNDFSTANSDASSPQAPGSKSAMSKGPAAEVQESKAYGPQQIPSDQPAAFTAAKLGKKGLTTNNYANVAANASKANNTLGNLKFINNGAFTPQAKDDKGKKRNSSELPSTGAEHESRHNRRNRKANEHVARIAMDTYNTYGDI